MVETLAGKCGKPGFLDGNAEEALFSTSAWDAYCALRDCSVIVSEPSNRALRLVQLPARHCAASGGGGAGGLGALTVSSRWLESIESSAAARMLVLQGPRAQPLHGWCSADDLLTLNVLR